VQLDPSYLIWTDGWTESHHERNNHFSELYEAPNRFSLILFGKIFIMHVLTLIWLGRTELVNAVTVVINCYDVVMPIPHCCKCDKNWM